MELIEWKGMDDTMEMTNMKVYNLTDASIITFEGNLAHWHGLEKPSLEIRYSIFNVSEDKQGAGVGHSSIGFNLTFEKGIISYYDANYGTPLWKLSCDVHELTQFVASKVQEPWLAERLQDRIHRDYADTTKWQEALTILQDKHTRVQPTEDYAKRVKKLRLPTLY